MKELADTLWQLNQAAYENNSPWKASQFAGDLALSHSHYFYETSDRMVAFLGFHQVLDEIEITNLSTHSQAKRRGLAEKLLRRLVTYAHEQQVATIFLEVRQSNLAAFNLYQKMGFTVIGKRKNYYHKPQEDAILMALKVGSK